jgi:hypothetical protein
MCRSADNLVSLFVVVTDLANVVGYSSSLCTRVRAGRVLDISSDQRMGQLGHNNICEVDQVALQRSNW